VVGDGCAVVVCDGQAAFLVDEIADERGVEDEILRADFVAGHPLGEGGDFGGGEGFVPNSYFAIPAISVFWSALSKIYSNIFDIGVCR